MDINKIFQKLIILALILVPLAICVAFFYTPGNYINEFNEKYYATWSNDDGMSFLLIIYLITIVLHLISYYMLYKFKKNGKRFFVITLIIAILFELFSGAYAVSSVEMVLNTISYLIGGAILALLYFSPVSKRFNKFP
tara:strand:- start:42 stop:455 length:414 start_codon:yes stop_codon:yes gene_type:complete